MLDTWKPPEDRLSRSIHAGCGSVVTGLVVLAITGIFFGLRGEGLWFATGSGALLGAALGYAFCGRFWAFLRMLVGGISGG